MKKKALPKVLPIKKFGRVHDKRTDTYVEIIEFAINDTDRRQAEWPPSIINDARAFEKNLRDKGARLPKDNVKAFLAEVAAKDCPKEFVYEARTGWSADRSIFVLPDRAIGPNTKHIRGVNQSIASDDETGRLTQAGTWQAWKSAVASTTAYSSLLIFAACAAFAAPLLAVASEGSFSLCIPGPTRTGKTIATLVSSSVIGIGRSEDLITWAITNARLDQRLDEYNDSVFPIDDFESMEDDDRHKYLHVRSLAYRLAQGVGKARSSVFTRSHGVSNARWRCIALTSSEKSIRELAQNAGMERQHGEALRFIDVPALVGTEEHIFDRVPPETGIKNFAQWKTATFAALRKACESNHGSAYRHYIEFLLKLDARLESFVKDKQEFFIKEVADSCDDDETRDVARKFSLLYAGGMLARESKLVDWRESDILAAISKFYVAARQMLPNEGELRREGIVLLKTKIASLRQIPWKREAPLPKNSFNDDDGVKENRWGKWTCLIKREAFDSIFVSRPQRNLVERWLIENGLITLAHSKKVANSSQPHPKEQHTWPDGQRRRSFEISWERDLLAGKAA